MKRSWPINLKTPSQVEYRDPSVLLDPREVHQWLDQLPLMRLNVTLEELRSAVQALNQQKVPFRNRIKLLNEYRKTLIHIYPSSEPEVLKRLPVKPEERAHTREDMGRLCHTLAEGFLVVLKEAYEAGEDASSPMLLHSLYYSLESLVLELVNHFRCYHAVRPGLYEEIYLLYKIAHQGDITKTPVSSEQKDLQGTTIDNLLIQALLLASADPFRLPQSAALGLFNIFRNYTSFVRLYIHESGPLSKYHYLINLNSDLPPAQVNRANQDLLHTNKLVLDKDALNRKIAADLTQLQANDRSSLNNDANEKITLLKILVPDADEKRVRRSERKEVKRQVKTIFGIESIFRFLSLGPDHLKILLDTNTNEFDGVTMETWTIQNESLTGYMLSRDTSPEREVRVGDILVIHNPQEDSAKHSGKIAVIRWMQQDSATNTQIGVELIPGKIMPAICRPGTLDNGAHASEKGIFISSVTALQQPATLLFPKKLYQRGRILHITVGDQPLTVRADFLREDSFCFDRFDFSSTET